MLCVIIYEPIIKVLSDRSSDKFSQVLMGKIPQGETEHKFFDHFCKLCQLNLGSNAAITHSFHLIKKLGIQVQGFLCVRAVS